MRKITYKTLKIQNFLSVGNDVVQIDFQHGLNQIDGKNIDNPERKNAVGKSVVINAHFFALFGETVNKIKSEFIVNNVTKGKGLIELDFDVETNQGIKSYTIKRQVKPSKVELWEGATDITKPSIKETDKYLCDLLQTNATIHRCCDIMTIRDTTPFMDMEAKDKRQFIEDIFSINVFGVMLKDLKKMVSETKSDLTTSSTKVTEIGNSLKTLIEQKEIIAKQNQEREAIFQKRKDELDTKIAEVQEKIDEIEIVDIAPINADIKKLHSGWEELDSRIGSCRVNKSQCDIIIKSKQDELLKCSGVDSGAKCDKCLQTIPHTHVDHLKLVMIELQDSIDATTVKLNDVIAEQEDLAELKTKIQRKIGELTDVVKESVSNSQKLEGLQNTLKQYQQSRLELDEDMENVATSLDSFDDNIKKTEERQLEESEILDDLKQKVADLDICKFILGEEGVKSFVVKKLLDMLNNTIEKYLVVLGMNVRCKFDEYFDEIISNDKGKVFSYKNGSGAEKKSLDFACALSFSDMRRKISQVSSNVEFYDEVFDNALDEKGLDLIMDALKERIENHNMSVYVISHRKEMKKHIDGETIMLEKENGITSRVFD